MVEIYLMKCICGINKNKFLYKHPASNEVPVWASSMEYARKFVIKEELELFALERNINKYEIITMVCDPEKLKEKK